MLNALLKRYNHYRKEKYFRSPLFHTRKNYAFVGFGIHSMTNFYPLLHHFNIRLKYICTKNSDWKQQLSPLFPDCSFTNDLDEILRDDSIAGVFVCTSPDAHYSILTRLFEAKKSVFVEKPPCFTATQLHQLIKMQAPVCKVGLQRRYWPGNKYIMNKCSEALSYIYQFHTGSYPQGDIFSELFIHPLDYSRFLFGEGDLQSFSRHSDDQGMIIQLHLKHPGNISGLLQLSTHHSWNPPFESLQVNGKKESLSIQYPASVTGKQAPLRIRNIPTERLMHLPVVTREYFSGSPSLLPAMETNTLMVQGFFGEIETFVSLVEGHNPPTTEKNDLRSLIKVYELMEKMK